MVDANSLKTKIYNRVFLGLGSTGTLYVRSNTSTDDVATYNTPSSIIIVPFNFLSSNNSYQSWGNVSAGEMDIAVPDTVTVSKNDKIVFQSKNYLVKQIELFPLRDVILCKVLRVKEEI